MKRSVTGLTTLDRTGLCGTCRQAQRIETARGTTFWRCRRSETDPRYPRYPPLPVLACPGHDPGPA